MVCLSLRTPSCLCAFACTAGSNITTRVVFSEITDTKRDLDQICSRISCPSDLQEFADGLDPPSFIPVIRVNCLFFYFFCACCRPSQNKNDETCRHPSDRYRSFKYEIAKGHMYQPMYLSSIHDVEIKLDSNPISQCKPHTRYRFDKCRCLDIFIWLGDTLVHINRYLHFQ